MPAGETGELWVRGAQVAGEYVGLGTRLDADGWFPTHDRAHLDPRATCSSRAVTTTRSSAAARTSRPPRSRTSCDPPGGARCGRRRNAGRAVGADYRAVVVAARGAEPDVEDLRGFVRGRLRGSRTPDRVIFRTELPTNATGKVLRRELVNELNARELA